ncbi:MAG TPA: hypothetical protein VME69_16230 [Methylocella sp.]|nr:hypothetical protein [Methylocella sp.]
MIDINALREKNAARWKVGTLTRHLPERLVTKALANQSSYKDIADRSGMGGGAWLFIASTH